MTAVAGLLHEKRVYIGADSAGVCTTTLSLMIRRDPKVFQVGPFLIGYTSSFRMGQVLRFGEAGSTLAELLVLHDKENSDPYDLVVTKLIPWCRRCFKEAGFAEKEKERESGGAFLVGFRSRLFSIGTDYQVAESVYPFDAVGCGADLVLGSLFSTAKLGKKLPPTIRVKMALEAAAAFSAGVRPPFLIRAL